MEWLDLLSDPAYRHMLLNHIPIVGLAMALLVMLIGLASRQAGIKLTGLGLVVLTAGTSWPVANYGDTAYPAIFGGLDGDGQAWLDYHVEMADVWLPVLFTTTIVAIVACLVSVLKPKLLTWATLVVLLLGSASFAGAVLVGKAGGQIKHPEFRVTDPP